MKRVGLVLASLSLLLLVTGCGEKKLDCSQKEDGMDMRVIFNFDGNDKITSGKMEMTMDFGDDFTDEELDEAISEMKNAAKDQGLDLNVTKKNTGIVMTYSFKADQITDMFGVEEDEYQVGYKKLKQQFEDEGATCK